MRVNEGDDDVAEVSDDDEFGRIGKKMYTSFLSLSVIVNVHACAMCVMAIDGN